MCIRDRNSDQPLAGRIDDAAADDAGSIAAKGHTHRERLFAAGAGFFEMVIQIEGHAGQIAEVLQEREEREKYGHGRQHDGDDPGQYAVDT